MENQTKKTKILYVITQGDWGGAQRYVFDLATNLGPNYDVTVAVGQLSGQQELQAKLAKLSNIKVIGLKYLIRSVSPLNDIKAIGELADLYKSVNPDVVHLNSSKAGVLGSYALRRLAALNRPKIVYTAHGWVFNEPVGGAVRGVYRYLEKSTAHDKAAVVVLSEHDKNSALDLGLAKEKINLIPHGINESGFESKRWPEKEFGITQEDRQNKLAFVTVANFYKTKGLDVLIKAVAQKKSVLQKCIFIIIGEGQERANLEDLIKQNGVGNLVKLVGFVESPQKYLNAQNFTAAVIPSYKEGLPYAMLEFLKARLPVIATAVGGIPEYIENKKSGLLVKPDSIDELADALVFAANNPDKMQEFAAHAPTPPSLREMIDKTTSLYSSLLR